MSSTKRTASERSPSAAPNSASQAESAQKKARVSEGGAVSAAADSALSANPSQAQIDLPEPPIASSSRSTSAAPTAFTTREIDMMVIAVFVEGESQSTWDQVASALGRPRLECAMGFVQAGGREKVNAYKIEQEMAAAQRASQATASVERASSVSTNGGGKGKQRESEPTQEAVAPVRALEQELFPIEDDAADAAAGSLRPESYNRQLRDWEFDEEEKLLAVVIEHKEQFGQPRWRAIAELFPGRSVGALQMRHSFLQTQLAIPKEPTPPEPRRQSRRKSTLPPTTPSPAPAKSPALPKASAPRAARTQSARAQPTPSTSQTPPVQAAVAKPKKTKVKKEVTTHGYLSKRGQGGWKPEEDALLQAWCFETEENSDWAAVAIELKPRNARQCESRWRELNFSKEQIAGEVFTKTAWNGYNDGLLIQKVLDHCRPLSSDDFDELAGLHFSWTHGAGCRKRWIQLTNDSDFIESSVVGQPRSFPQWTWPKERMLFREFFKDEGLFDDDVNWPRIASLVGHTPLACKARWHAMRLKVFIPPPLSKHSAVRPKAEPVDERVSSLPTPPEAPRATSEHQPSQGSTLRIEEEEDVKPFIA